jgi:hypothetical protein
MAQLWKDMTLTFESEVHGAARDVFWMAVA